MFKKKKTDLNQTDTLIGEETAMEGELRSQTSIRIEGKFTGNITCEGDCIIGENGHAESNVRARNISIAGEVRGHMKAQETLTILSTGVLIGDCQAAKLIIEEGGLFNGKSSMTGGSEAKEASAPAGGSEETGGSISASREETEAAAQAP